MDFTNSPPEWQNNGEEPSQSLKESGFTPGYKPPAAYFNWFWSKVGKCLSEIQNKMLGQKRVTELPSTTREYTFDTETAFAAVERCTLGLVTEGSDKFLRVTTSDKSGNKYALAQLNFADIGQNADTFAVEMDTRMPGGRWYVSVVDLSKRPGESDKTSYDTAGVAFSCGTKDGTNYNVNNTNVFSNGFADKWLHTKIVVNITAKTATYEIKDRTTNTLMASGTVSFRDSGTDKITGIELYSYTQTTIDIDNLKIIAGYNIEENILYSVGTDETYDTYAYFDGKPICISSQTDIKLLKENTHTHSNKNVLDDISSSDVSNWNNKANINSPTFTGTPTAPTPDDNEESDRIATTLYVHRILEKSYSGNLDNIFAKSTDEPVVDLLCIGADNTPNGYNGTLSCVMTYHDQSEYNRHRYSQSYMAGPDFDEYTRSYEYGSGWTDWVVLE